MKVTYKFLDAALREVELERNRTYDVGYVKNVIIKRDGSPGSEDELEITMFIAVGSS